MKRLTCEMCGSTDLVKQDGFFVCQTCGCKYSVEEAKKMMIEGTVEVQGTVKTDLSDQVNNLLDRVKNFIKKSEWEKAYDYIDKILDLNNACPEAYYYKMLAILKKSSMDEININEFIECDDEEFDEERAGDEYYRYRRYGGEPIKTVLYDEIKNGEFDIALKMGASAELNSLQLVRTDLGELQSSFWVKGKTLIYSNIREGRVVIPDGITKIDDGAFYGNEIHELVLPDSVIEIGVRSFSIGSISKIKWSQNLKIIGVSAFENGFYDSYDIDLPDSVEFIGKKAFFDDSVLPKAKVRIPSKVKVLNTTLNIDKESTIEVDTTFGWALNLSPSENYFNFDYRNNGNIISKRILSSPIKLAALLKGKDWALYKLSEEDEEFINSRMISEINELRNSAELAISDKNYFEAESVYENILKINLEDIDAQFKLSCCRILCLEPYHYSDYHNNDLYGEDNWQNRWEACSRLEELATAPQELIEPLIKSIINSSQNIEDKQAYIKANMDLSIMTANDLYYFINKLNGELRQNFDVYNAHRISYKLLDRFGEIVFKLGGTEYINDVCVPCWRDALEKCRMVMESVFYEFGRKELEQDLLQIEAKLVQYDHTYKKQETTPPAEKNTTGGCYVATCVYGSYDCPQVWTLRRFRDDKLGSTWYGRAFIHIYYAVSPTLVKWFGETKWFKKLWKGKLDKLVKKLNCNGVENTPYNDKDWQNKQLKK